MDFLSYWDKRIEANKRLFDKNSGLANFLFDECQLLYEHMIKENNELKRLLAMQSDLDLQGYEHMRDELRELNTDLAPLVEWWKAQRYDMVTYLPTRLTVYLAAIARLVGEE